MVEIVFLCDNYAMIFYWFMDMKRLTLSFCIVALFVGMANAQQNDTEILDSYHQKVQAALQQGAYRINGWFGEPQKDNPAEAQLRVIFDNRWDKHDGFSIKPRLRGRLKLPALKDRLNIVFGDESIDNELEDAANISSQSVQKKQDKTFDSQQSRRDNSSLGLQWLLGEQDDNIDTRVSLGIRSGGDIYTKLKVAKNWYHPHHLRSRTEGIYRYGSKSEHFARVNLELSHADVGKPLSKGQVFLEYKNDDSEDWHWGSSYSRQHPTGKDTWFNYGLYVGGYIENGEMSLNTYGPFAGLRTNVYRDWLFVQPEITYYNDKREGHDHHIGVMVRLEAQF